MRVEDLIEHWRNGKPIYHEGREWWVTSVGCTRASFDWHEIDGRTYLMGGGGTYVWLARPLGAFRKYRYAWARARLNGIEGLVIYEEGEAH